MTDDSFFEMKCKELYVRLPLTIKDLDFALLILRAHRDYLNEKLKKEMGK